MNPPTPDQRPLIIIDNNLLDDRGHHLALARTLANEALERGREVHFYAHRNFGGTELDARIHVHKVFATSIYEIFAQKRNDIDLSPDFEAVFAEVARTHTDGGIVLMHTSDAHIYRAFARWIRNEVFVRNDRLVWHLCTPYEMRLLPGAKAIKSPVTQQIWQISRSPFAGKRIFFWGETERLATYYSRLFRTVVNVLPLPTPQWISHPVERFDPPEKLTLLFLGAAREEKGFTLLPNFAAEIAKDPVLSQSMDLRIQCSAPLAGFQHIVTQAIEQLEAFSFVTLIHGPLTVSEYAREFLSSDVLWVLYKPENYFARGSAIAMEAFCAGKHLLLSRGMFIDSMDDMGLALPGGGPKEWIAHLRTLTADLDARREAAARTGQIMTDRYSAHSYLNRMLNRERYATHFAQEASAFTEETMPMLAHPATRPLRPNSLVGQR